MLSDTIGYSWNAHEGFAVSRERMYGSLMYPDHQHSKLPTEYEDAYRKYQAIIERLPKNLKLFGSMAARAVGEAVLNTDILGRIEPQAFTPAVVRKAIDESDRPDERLDRLLKILTDGPLPSDFGDDLPDKVRTLFAGTPLSERRDLEDAIASLFSLITPEVVSVIGPLDTMATNAFFEFFTLVAPKLNIRNPHNVEHEVVDFHNAVADRLQAGGLVIIRTKIGTHHEGVREGTDARVVLPLPNPIYVDEGSANATVDAVLKSGSHLMLQFGRWDPPPETLDTHFLLVTAMEMEAIGTLTPGARQPYGAKLQGQFVISGEQPYIERIAKQMWPRVLQVCIGLSAVTPDELAIRDDMKFVLDDLPSDKQVLVLLPQVRFTVLLHFLSLLEKNGIREAKVIGLDKYMWYLAVETSSKLTVILKIPAALPAIQRAHGEPFPDYIYDAIEHPKKKLEDLGFLASVPQLDLLGLFSPV